MLNQVFAIIFLLKTCCCKAPLWIKYSLHKLIPYCSLTTYLCFCGDVVTELPSSPISRVALSRGFAQVRKAIVKHSSRELLLICGSKAIKGH